MPLVTDGGELTLKGFVYLLKEQRNARSLRDAEIVKTTDEMFKTLVARAPVAKGTFRSSWDKTVVLGNTCTIRIFNDAGHAPAIEGGILPGNKPWVRETKFVVEKNGLLWSRKAPEGTIRFVLGRPPKYHLIDRFAHRIGNAMIKGIFGNGSS